MLQLAWNETDFLDYLEVLPFHGSCIRYRNVPAGRAPQLRIVAVTRNAVSHFVAKLVKSFSGLCNAAESLDDFRYRRAQFTLRR